MQRSSARSLLLALAVGLLGVALASGQEPPPDDPPPIKEPLPTDDPPPAEDPIPEAPEAQTDAQEESRRLVGEAAGAHARAQPDMANAFDLLGRQEWRACIEPFRNAAKELDPHALLGGVRDQCLYNVACAHARLGELDAAVAALGESLEHGLRDALAPRSDGTVVFQRGLTLPHLLVDSDLDPLRSRADFQALLAPLLRAGDIELEPTGAVVDSDARGLPGVIVLLRSDGTREAEAAAWRDALASVPAVVAFVEGPVRPNPNVRRWLLTDGDARFAVEKAASALDLLRRDVRVDPARVVVAAAGSAAAEAAWALAFERSSDVAALALGPGRFHAAWHADALAGLAAARADAAAWDVRLVGPAPRTSELLAAAGVAVTELPLPESPDDAPVLERFAALRAVVATALAEVLR